MKITIVDGSSGIAELQLGIGARRAAQIRISDFEFIGAGEAFTGVGTGYWRPAGAVTHRRQRVAHGLLLRMRPELTPLPSAGYSRPPRAVTHSRH